MKYFALTFFKEKIVIKNGQRCAKGAFRKNGYSIMYEKTGSFFGPPQRGGGARAPGAPHSKIAPAP